MQRELEQAHAKRAARYNKAGNFARAAEYRSTAFGGGIDATPGVALVAGASTVLSICANALTAIGCRSPAKTNSHALAGGFTVVQGLPSPPSHTPAPVGKPIKEGLHGMVFHHRDSPYKVVKKLDDPGNDASMNEVKMYPVLSKIKTLTNGDFLTLNAEVHDCPLPRCLSIVMDKFLRQTDDYISGDPAIVDPKARLLTAGKLRDEVGLGDPNDFQKAIKGLLVQYKILHRFGVAHGDAHTGNSGLVVGEDNTPRFVIIDPTFSVISPLSEHWDQLQTNESLRVWGPLMKHILPMMRGVTRQGMQNGFRFQLNKRIRDLADEHSIKEFLKNLVEGNPMKTDPRTIDPGKDADGDPYPNSIAVIEELVDQHNAVIDKMNEDWTRLIEHIYPTNMAEGRRIVNGIQWRAGNQGAA